MNYKLEKFWNLSIHRVPWAPAMMNYKLEKFWNLILASSLPETTSYEL